MQALGDPFDASMPDGKADRPKHATANVRIVYFQIDEVPILSLLVMIAVIIAVSIFVCPGGLTGKIVQCEICPGPL